MSRVPATKAWNLKYMGHFRNYNFDFNQYAFESKITSIITEKPILIRSFVSSSSMTLSIDTAVFIVSMDTFVELTSTAKVSYNWKVRQKQIARNIWFINNSKILKFKLKIISINTNNWPKFPLKSYGGIIYKICLNPIAS